MFGRWKKKNQNKTEGPAPAGYEIVASLLSDVGCVREINEDCGRLVRPGDTKVLEGKGVLAIVADGMGGHSAGEVASKLAVDTVSRLYYDNSEEPQSALKKAVLRANREIYQTALKDEKLKGMGTTCTALVLQNGSAISAHVGDSRIYLIRDGEIYLMTEDHSAVMEMVKLGILTLDQARHHPDKNIILRALGSQPEVEVSTWNEPFPVREGDCFLLCSDGLYDLVSDDEIKQAVLEENPVAACKRLIEIAKARGGHDNITIGVVCLKPETVGEARATPETREVEVKI